MIWLLRIPAVLLLVLTLLPLIPTGFWFVRGWDFPRLQITMVATVVLGLSLFCLWRCESKAEPAVWGVMLVCVLVWQGSHVIQFSPLWPREVETASDSAATTRLMVVNLKIENDSYDAVIAEIREESPDILLLIEVNKDWREGLEPLRGDFDYHHEVVRDEGLGLVLWTRLETQNMETRHLVSERRATIWAELTLQNGQPVNFVGVHPTPPGLLDSTGEERRDSRVRDAELLMVAREIADRNEECWIVAGDFNDVAWSHTTRLFKRISGLKDPRIGRSFMGTFHSQYPLLRFPIDHVMLSDGFRVGQLARKQITGSDHFSVLVSLEHSLIKTGVTPEPEGNDDADASALIEEGLEDAERRDVKADDGNATNLSRPAIAPR